MSDVKIEYEFLSGNWLKMIWNGEHTFGYMYHDGAKIFVGLQSKISHFRKLDELRQVWNSNNEDELGCYFSDALGKRFNTFSTHTLLENIEVQIETANLSDNIANEIKQVKQLWKQRIMS